jgi:hypothetical protein
MTWDYVEVVFKNGDEYYTGAAARGDDVRFTLPEGNYQAVMFAGVVKETRLLAVGVPTSEDGTGTTPDGRGSIEITASTKHIIFALSALSADIVSGGSFHLAVGANAVEGTYALDGEDVPYFHVPVNEAEIAGTFRIGGFTCVDDGDLFNTAGLFGVLGAAGDKSIIQAIGTSSYDLFTGKLVPPMAVGGEVKEIGIDGGVLAIDFELATNVNSLTAGFSRMRFDVPIQAFTAGSAAAGRGSVWHIVNGLEAVWDLGGDSMGENILLYTGDTYYVSDDIGNNANHGMTEDKPFETLAKAAEAAMDNSLCKNIIVLTDIAVPEAFTIDATDAVNTNVVTIRSKTGGTKASVTTATGNNGSVITIMGGAKIAFKDITITGGNTQNRGLMVTGDGTAVTLGADAVISGKLTSSGGGVRVEASARFTMSDGEIIGSVQSDGGGVYVDGGTFEMKGGEIKGETTYDNGGGGGGVYMNGGTFTMSGGDISGEADGWNGGGGGVYMKGGTFTMSGGDISGEADGYNGGGGGVYMTGTTAASSTFTMSGGSINGSTSSGSGGGVYMNGGKFTMEGTAIISGNATSSTGMGGGVYMNGSSEFNISGGKISGSTAGSYGGGGVYMTGTTAASSTFTMSGGMIIDNEAQNGGGVNMIDNSTFTMTGGKISGNTATTNGGGGVLVGDNSTFTMTSGEISGNTATAGNGGGVNVGGSGTFTKTAGIIYGVGDPLANTATGGNGHAVYAASGGKYRNGTLDAGDGISTGILTNPPWDN